MSFLPSFRKSTISRSNPKKKSSSKRALRFLFFASFLSTFSLLLLGVFNSSLLDVQSVKVLNAQETGEQKVMTVADIEVGGSLLFLDTQEIKGRVESLPWVSTVEVARSLDGEVALTISERAPVGVFSTESAFILVDAEGIQLESTSTPPEDLLKVVGLEVSGTLGSSITVEAKGFMSLALYMDTYFPDQLDNFVLREGQLEASHVNGANIEFGQPDLGEQKRVALQTVLDKVDLVCLESIDVQVPSVPVVKRVEGCGEV